MKCKWFIAWIGTLGLTLGLIAAMACPQSRPENQTPLANGQPQKLMQMDDLNEPSRPATKSQLISTPSAATQSAVVLGTNQFGLALLQKLAPVEKSENHLISPASVAIALAMTLNGALADTHDAMAQVLGLTALTDEQISNTHLQLRKALTHEESDIQLTVANSLWAREGLIFEKPFLDINLTFFDARVEDLDFNDPQASGVINDWVADATGGKIQKIVPDQIDSSTILFLINTVYFKGDWTEPFDPTLTSDGPFHLADGQTIQTPMMKRDGYFDLRREERFEAVRLPYGEDKQLSMILVLPNKGLSPETLMQALTSDTIDSLSAGFRSMDGKLRLPRFTMRDDLELKPPLTALGMGVAFTGKADFGRMIAQPAQVMIDSVHHSTFIEVNEEGTEAAAATSVMMALTAMVEKPVVVFDRPFLFMIRDEASGLILFLGIVNDPRESQP